MKRRRNPKPNAGGSDDLRRILAAAAAMTASGDEPRRHHLVPKFYLERWATGGRVKVTDLTNDRHAFLSAPENALFEIDYYRVPEGTVEGGSPVVWEAWLSKVEGDAAEVFAAVDERGLGELDESQWARLLTFLSVQVTRSRSFRFRGRWMMGAGYYRLMELDREGAIEALLARTGEDPSAEHIAELQAYFAQANADPWSIPMAAGWEMDTASRSAESLVDTLATRKFLIYNTTVPLLTSDEPVVLLNENMGAKHHPEGGGFFGAPIVVFPFGPHQVLAMFRENMPVLRSADTKLDWSETLELNRVIAGNAHRNVVEVRAGRLGANLFLPTLKDPVGMLSIPPADGAGQEIIWMPSQTRWHEQRGAPTRPVRSWWPDILPPHLTGPRRTPNGKQSGKLTTRDPLQQDP